MNLPILDVLTRNFPQITDDYKSFALKKDQCRACSIYNDYQQVTQAEGCVDNPTFMFLGEAPGSDEADQNRPFIGQAGQRIRSELRKYPSVFNKQNTLISNVVACRPLNNKFPDDKTARNCCNLWLHEEIKLVKPKIVVVLGAQPLKFVREEIGITKLRGTWKHLNKYHIWCFATYHPSFVIRCERSKDYDKVKQFEEDIATLATDWETKISTWTSGD